MTITTKGHELSTAVEQAAQLFFDVHSDLEVESVVENGLASARVSKDGLTGMGSWPVPETPDKKALSNSVKKAVLLACKEISDMPTPWGISTGIRPAKLARLLLEEGKTPAEAAAELENEYWIEPDRARLCIDVAQKEQKIIGMAGEKAVSLYVGIPFCPTRCAYCSFISQALTHNNKFLLPYVDACEREIRRCGEISAELGLKPVSAYFGGGTPTAIPAELLERLIKTLKSSFDMSELRELTVEAGRPDTLTPEMMSMLRKNGIRRISINPQSMHQSTLDAIGRRHSPEDVERAFALARREGMEIINADLILGLPGEDVNMLSETLDRITALGPDTVTVHTMYLKRAARLRDDFEKLRFARNVNEMMELCRRRMSEYGAEPYYMYKQKNTLGNLENVGFAKPGSECLYNVYIMEEVHSILAMGGGASTKLVRGDRIERIFNPKEAGDYVNRIEEILNKKQFIKEFLG